MNKHYCDMCGKETFINPPFEKVFHEDTNLPVYDTIDQFDMATGKVFSKKVHKLKLLKPRTLFIRVHVGSEYVIRDICDECYTTNKDLQNHCKNLYDFLKNIKPKEEETNGS